MSARRRGLMRPATVSGPRNSMATAVPSGMRATAARKKVVMKPVTMPRTSRAGRWRSRRLRSAGRAMSHRNTMPKLIRSHAVPAGPTWAMTGTDSALETCTASIAATAIVHGGTVDGAAAGTACSLLMAAGNRSGLSAVASSQTWRDPLGRRHGAGERHAGFAVHRSALRHHRRRAAQVPGCWESGTPRARREGSRVPGLRRTSGTVLTRRGRRTGWGTAAAGAHR